MRRIALAVALLVAASAAAGSGVRVTIKKQGCARDQCSVRAVIENETRHPIAGVVLYCRAQKGLDLILGETQIDLGTLRPGVPVNKHFPIWIEGGAIATRVVCEAGY